MNEIKGYTLIKDPEQIKLQEMREALRECADHLKVTTDSLGNLWLYLNGEQTIFSLHLLSFLRGEVNGK